VDYREYEIMKYDTVPESVVDELLADIRPDDLAEMSAYDVEPRALLIQDVANASEVWVGRKAGRLVAMWGVVPSPSSSTSCGLWMFSTYEMERCKRAMLALSEAFVVHLADRFEKIYVEVDSRYERACRWLKRIGFETVLGTTHGKDMIPFNIMLYTRE